MHEIMEFCVTSSLALDNWRKYCQTLGNKPNHSHRLLRRRLFSKGKNFKLFNSLFHLVYLVFPKSLFSIADLFTVCYLWVVCNEDKCCVVTQRAADIRVSWLVCLACLRSHVLRAYCNFESKQANSITLFGQRPNNKANNMFWIVLKRRKLKPKLNLRLKLWKGLGSPVIDVTVMKDSLLFYVLKFFRYFWSSMPNWTRISTRACAADYLKLRDSQKRGDLIFLGRIFLRLLLVPDMCTTLKNIIFRFLFFT